MRKIRTLTKLQSLDELEHSIESALSQKLPYLLLRLGDGEGSCVRVDLDDDASYSEYYRENRREFLDIWFKDTTALDDQEFSVVIDIFNDSIKNADCIGGIYSAAIEHEFKLGSKRGIAWVVNTMRKVSSLAESDPHWASNVTIQSLTVHYELLLRGTLHRLLKNREHVGLISCHSNFAVKLEKTFDIKTIEFYKIPGEKIHTEHLTSEDLEGRHWPERFNELCKIFDEGDRRGQLFLVAAGFLGKVYASKLKNSGAVVLDIGAAADLWLGKMTRSFPTLPPHLRLVE